MKTNTIVIFITIFFLSILFLYIYKSSPENFLKNSLQFDDSAKIARPSATLKPTPTPIPIPAHSGRRVQVPILTYHYIGNNPNPEDKARDNLSVAPDKFEEQIKYIYENGYQSISFDTLYSALKSGASLPPKSIILTFDDGYMDFYLIAFPILKRYNMYSVSFIPTGLIGTSYYMNWDQVKELDLTGLVSFQSHSVNHLNLTSLNTEQLMYQLTMSKATLERNLGKTVNTLAYPYGISNYRVWEGARNAGYIGAAGTWFDKTQSEGVILYMPRIKVAGGADLKSFILKL